MSSCCVDPLTCGHLSCPTVLSGAGCICRYGITHIRYSCDAKTWWLLTYALTDRVYNTDPSNMWVGVCIGAGGSPCDQGGGEQALDFKWGYSGTQADGDCSLNQLAATSTCPTTTCIAGTTTTPPNCPWCCTNMWAVLDNNVWVGYMVKFSFEVPTTLSTTYSRLSIHWNAILTGGGGATVSSTTANSAQGLCLDCTGEPITCDT